MKKTLYWILTLLFPLLILGMAELFLRIGGYSEHSQDLFEEVSSQPNFLVTNSDFVSRYFPSFSPQVAVSPFRKVKHDDVFRVFVLGGSSTQGFPYNFYYSFAEQLEQQLILNTKGLNVEVINLGMTAVNSYVIWDLSKRLIEYQPDAVIIYAGHNEYYGSFGAGSTQFGMINNTLVKRTVLVLKNFRLYQLLENLFNSPAQKEPKQGTMMASVVKEANIELGGEIYQSGIDQYRENIGDVLELFKRNGVPVLIGSVASNLKDQPPLSDNKDALEKYAAGQEYYRKGEKDSALTAFNRAKELDEVRFRAPDQINSVIRDLAGNSNVTFVDVEEMLRGSSQSGIEDRSLFIDHLHPTAEGHALMAGLFFEHLRGHEKIKRSYVPNVFSIPDKISQFESSYADITISRLLFGYPFQKGLSPDEEAQKFDALYTKYLKTSFIDSVAAFAKVNQQAVPNALKKIVDYKMTQGDTLQVMSHYYELLKWQLNSRNLIEKAIEYSVNNAEVTTYLVNSIEQVLNEGAYDPRYMNVVSSVYIDNGSFEKAKYWLDESLRLKSTEPALFYNLARYHIIKKDTVKAGEFYKRYLQARQN